MAALDRVTMCLRVQASAQREIAANIRPSETNAAAMIASHRDSARLFDLLNRAVDDGLLAELEARYGA